MWPTDDHCPNLVRDAADAAFSQERLGTTNAVVIVRSGAVIYERYAGVQEYFDRPSEPITPKSELLSWSMAKSILHCAVGILLNEGRLDLNARGVVPEWAGENDPRHDITLGHLLAMRDGLDFLEAYEIERASDVIEMLFGTGRNDVSGFALNRSLAHPPGSTFNYSSGTSNIVSRIVANVVGYGDPYRAFLAERIFRPLGMTSARATFDETGVFVASSYVHATALDFARFGLLYLRGGQWGDQHIVPREWVESAQVPLSCDEESGHFYSNQWWVSGDEWGTYWASGYEGQMISVVPALDAIIVRCGHTPDENYPALYQWRREVLNALAH